MPKRALPTLARIDPEPRLWISPADARPRGLADGAPIRIYNERGEMVPTAIAGEHPLTVYVDKREIVTLMTLGHAPEALAIGYLRNQRLADSIDDIAAWLQTGTTAGAMSAAELEADAARVLECGPLAERAVRPASARGASGLHSAILLTGAFFLVSLAFLAFVDEVRGRKQIE